MCKKAVENDPYMFKYVPDHHKTQDMCDTAIRNNSTYIFLFLLV